MACTRLVKTEKLLDLVGPLVPEEMKMEFLLAVDDASIEVNNMAYRQGVQAAVNELMRQYHGCQPGTLVSYHIAADVLSVELLGHRQDEQEEK
jgi:hypothetical protein